MVSLLKYMPLVALFLSCTSVRKVSSTSRDPHRPLLHFTPQSGWMNDPNGMVYHNGTYHLFYQYYPDSTVWGPMHWGHATSPDLVRWTHQPIALFPDSLGYIFSGSAVVDVNNTAGLAKAGEVPLVAIYTSHDINGERAGKTDYETQSIAYSTDDGKSWTKYAGNPVLRNPGVRDFRDPKVRWFEGRKRWIMTLATQDRISFFSSPNLKDWTKESEFGDKMGAHGGVWECPDLFPLSVDGKEHWVLVVNLNPGGPNGGSATQYFVGRFDGHNFTPYATDTRWLDYGPDEYAGITWSNTGDRRIFLGWMSNWAYANVVPTKRWRSAMTVPRELRLVKAGDRYLLSSAPVKELSGLAGQPVNLQPGVSAPLPSAARLHLQMGGADDVAITLSNDLGQRVIIGYDKSANGYFIDRTMAGKTGFAKGFAARHTAPRLSSNEGLDLTLIIDRASVELFADDGLTVMTSIFFPDKDFSMLRIDPATSSALQSAQLSQLNAPADKR